MLPKKDRQTVTSEGELIAPRIEGVIVRPAKTIPDERGAVTEIYNPDWGINPDPLVYAYMVTIRPGKIKGWIKHLTYEDRLFFYSGTARAVLYDDRAESPTYKMVNQLFIGEENRALLVIPRGVYHAFQNVDTTTCVFANMPTRPYQHDDPDKFRLPLENDVIPFSFFDVPHGW